MEDLQKQGIRLLDFRKQQKKDKNMLIEGFENNSDKKELWNEGNTTGMNISEEIEKDLNKINELEKVYLQKLSEYTNTYKTYMTEVSNEVNSEQSKYVGKNIKTKDGSIYYINNLGYAQPYPDNSIKDLNSSCSNEVVNVDAKNIQDLGFIKGAVLKKNTPCGYAGKSIYVDEGSTTVTYKGCFKDKSDRAIPHKIGESMTYNEAIDAAIKGGYNTIGLQDNPSVGENKAQVFAGNNPDYDKYGVASCNTLDNGKKAGGAWVNAVYHIENSNENMGKMGYVDKQNQLLMYDKSIPDGCPQTKMGVSEDIFDAFYKSDNNGKGVICSLPFGNNENKTKLEKLNKELMSLVEELNARVQNTRTKITNIENQNSEEVQYFNSKLNEYKSMYEKHNNKDNKGIASLSAMVEDISLVETSSKYYYIFWSLAAIISMYIAFRHIK